MTPYELNLHIVDYMKREKVENEERIAHAYMTAAWSRAEKLPSLKSILQKANQTQTTTPKKTKTAEEMLEFVKQMQNAIES